jgi:hypothetical protein
MYATRDASGEDEQGGNIDANDGYLFQIQDHTLNYPLQATLC